MNRNFDVDDVLEACKIAINSCNQLLEKCKSKDAFEDSIIDSINRLEEIKNFCEIRFALDSKILLNYNDVLLLWGYNLSPRSSDD